MLLFRNASEERTAGAKLRIGLALSGGGFRASIFHLGVIRRLEELGIMPEVSVISSVSGGSIIAAYYACRMEDKLRSLPVGHVPTSEERVAFFESIADDFLAATDHNLRTRALVYTPFFHTFSFVKTLLSRPFRQTARSELIQKEYDKWFYHDDTLDELPSVTPDQGDPTPGVIYGPKLILNTTSLISGERVSFSRQPVSKFMQMSKVNKNVLPLSRVVGASACVPGLFPPTAIAGDVLVDGGVSDNQGIEGLVHESGGCDVLIVSDASGQMEELDSISTGEVTVLSRVNSVLQFQVRAKTLEILLAWKRQLQDHEFAFMHLFLSLKDRLEKNRLPSEYIPAVARIRTDLDQFSYIETEALMYHGYTLVDAQLNEYCPKLQRTPAPPLTVPPLFRETTADPEARRNVIKKDLKAGAQNIYLLRCAEKYHRMWWVLALGGAVGLALVYLAVSVSLTPLHAVQDMIGRMIYGLIPSVVQYPLDQLLVHLGLTTLRNTVQGIAGISALVAFLAAALYLVSFPVYASVRAYSLHLDRMLYKKITGEEWSTHWKTEETSDVVSGVAAGRL
jgi:predicted acylesterase/phospholipase RssA